MPADIPRLTRAFAERHGRPPSLIAEAPGRVNLIGEHTDYNQGFVLPAAIDLTIAVAAAPRDDDRIVVHALDPDQADDFRLSVAKRHPMGSWRNYVRGVVWALLDSQIPLVGADLSVTGDIPDGAGLSSSAALEFSVAGVLCAAAGADVPPRDLALLCQSAEHMYAGVQCGIMDQFASALGVVGHALFIDCRTLDAEPVALPPGVAIVVIDSRVPRNLAATPYNQRREECADAARLLGVPALRDADGAFLAATGDRLTDGLYRRARHVVTENARVLHARDAIIAADLARIGQLLAESHTSLRDDFEVSTPELDALVEIAAGTPGVIGARMTGAGFGGCTVNLVAAAQAESFIAHVLPEYAARMGIAAEAYITHATDGMRVHNV
ncbi:MAG TPA: galactokinase [Dehalococcoidia bacterium]|nr:galactokinase [Dehalococcoidia bacterium]